MSTLRTSRRSPVLLATLLAVLAACGERTPAEQVARLGVQNVSEPVPNLITAAQPDRDQVEALVGMGYEHFISLQLPGEPGAGWEESGVPAAGRTFVRIPVGGADDLTRENVALLARVLEEAGGDPTVLYCASSNRAGALLALKAFWVDGMSVEEALSLGRRAGMRALEPDVRRIMAEEG